MRHPLVVKSTDLGGDCPSFWRGPSLRRRRSERRSGRCSGLPLLLEGPFIEAAGVALVKGFSRLKLPLLLEGPFIEALLVVGSSFGWPSHCPSFWRGPSLRQVAGGQGPGGQVQLPLSLEGPFIEAAAVPIGFRRSIRLPLLLEGPFIEALCTTRTNQEGPHIAPPSGGALH